MLSVVAHVNNPSTQEVEDCYKFEQPLLQSETLSQKSDRQTITNTG